MEDHHLVAASSHYIACLHNGDRVRGARRNPAPPPLPFPISTANTFFSYMTDDVATKRPRLCLSSISAGRRQGEGEETEEEDSQPLLPGLPDHLAQHCIAHLPAPLLFSVCRSWRRLLYSPSFPPFLSIFALLSPSDDAGGDPVSFHSFDPIAARWAPLPAPPPHPPLRLLLLQHPSFIARSLSVQSVAVAGHLVVLAATTHRLVPALPRPLVFHPASRRWRLGPPLHAPRRWCAAGAADGAVYLVSGVGTDYNTDVARSAERWDPAAGAIAGWERVAPLPDGRFSREAVEAVASRGKLCMVNVRGRAAKQGTVYDIRADRWEEMPPGMLAGWTGPAASAADDDDEGGGCIYVVDERSGALKAYDWYADSWATVAESELLKGAAQMAVGGGRACVVCGDGRAMVVVDVAMAPARIWVVEPPEGKRALTVHVLPRLSSSGSS
ncbi:F-box/kelch-repeat protein SKIP25-like [Musa acuminata AAA Group]|uniref:F-box/kelch-repeat protein SKIP25-like n=1 Tax=Musa acuminata AAA Group TaxID=214697 RepID=UPI0031DB5538